MSQILYLISPRMRGEFKSELISRDWMAGIFHSFKTCGNLVSIQRKATFQRVEYSQIMTRNNASCINPLQLYHTLCAFTNHSYWLYRYEQDQQWKFSEMCSRKLDLILLSSSAVFWLWIFMAVNDVEEGRTHLQFWIAGLAKEGVGSSKYSGCKHISPSHWEQNKYPNPQMTLFQFEVWSLVC